MYRATWGAAVGEELECRRERSNRVDRYAVTVVKDDTVVDHVPLKTYWFCSLFLMHRGGVGPLGFHSCSLGTGLKYWSNAKESRTQAKHMSTSTRPKTLFVGLILI